MRSGGGAYQPLRPAPDRGLTSRTLGITFLPQDRSLRMTDAQTGRLLLTYEEWKAKAEAAEERAEAAEERAKAAEERARALAEELDRLRRRHNGTPR